MSCAYPNHADLEPPLADGRCKICTVSAEINSYLNWVNDKETTRQPDLNKMKNAKSEKKM